VSVAKKSRKRLVQSGSNGEKIGGWQMPPRNYQLEFLRRLSHKRTMSEIKQTPGWLRPVVEYGPLATFFGAYYLADLFVATASIMVAAALALALSYIVERRVPMMPLIMAGIIGVFGGLTLWLQDETFIKMKPTIIQAIFGTVLISGLLANRLFLKSLMGAAWNITDGGWRILTLRFALFFFLSAILNEAIWRTQSTDFWVNFKVFGLIGLTFIFILTQLPLLKRFAIKDNGTTDTR
jgi:intracellular septation protein